MKVVVLGGTGLVGARVTVALRAQGHDVVVASPSMGVDAVTGVGLARALAGAQVAIDVTNAPSWEPEAVVDFFQRSSQNQAEAERDAGVQHHIALSIVGVDDMLDNPYMVAKAAQESVIRGSVIPWTILRATQFFEFLETVFGSFDVAENDLHVPEARINPVAVADVAALLVELAGSAPAGMLEIGGPEVVPFVDLAERLGAAGPRRGVVVDAGARYFGAAVNDDQLVAGPGARIGRTTLEQWTTRRRAGTEPSQ